MTFPTTTLNRLVVNKDSATGLLLCHSWIHSIGKEGPGVLLIPYKELISILLAEEAHSANHEGIAAILLQMRKRAWVVHGPRVALKDVDSCMHCRKCRAKIMLSSNERSPFCTHWASSSFQVHNAGPIWSIHSQGCCEVARKEEGVVFSCMALRAIHADLVEDLSTEGFLKTYQRFTSLRGHPKKLWSDQGSNFVGARPALEDLYSLLAGIDKEVQRRAVVAGTDWVWEFSPADSPHRPVGRTSPVRLAKVACPSQECHRRRPGMGCRPKRPPGSIQAWSC